MLVAVVVAWIALALAQNGIVVAFSAQGVTAELVRLFCSLLAGSFLFTGALYVANAAFNNLGFPLLSTAFNWGRATLGTIPFAAGDGLRAARGADRPGGRIAAVRYRGDDHGVSGNRRPGPARGVGTAPASPGTKHPERKFRADHVDHPFRPQRRA